MSKRAPWLTTILGIILSLFALTSCGNLAAGTSTPSPASFPAAEVQKQARGQLAVRILWPINQADPLRAASIPDSAASIVVSVTNQNSYPMGSTTVARSSGQLSVSANVTVAIGTNYSVTAKAYDGAGGTGNLIAQGNASGVTITQNNTTNVSVVMGALNAPTITALSQSNGGPGASLVLTGTNFGYTGNTSYQAYFNATANSDNTVTGTQAATLSRTSDTSITVTVPTGATNGNIIVRADGIPSVSTANFTVIQTLTISPTTPSVATGSTLTFSVSATDTSSQAVTSPVVTWTSSDTSSGTIASTGVLTGVAGGTTTVTVASGNINSATSASVSPTISSLSPASGGPGDSITITGSGFRASQGTSTVKFNGTAAGTAASWSNTSITVAVPTGATNGNVVVTVNSQASNGAAFTTVPSITSLSAISGIVGASITIAGAAFGASQGASTVTFGGTNATVSSWSNSSITAAVPSLTPGSRPVVVTTANGTSGGSSFTVIPNLSSLSPTSGAQGTSVTLTGSNFGSTQGSSTVTVGGTTATVSSWSNASIVIATPAGLAAGSSTVIVTVNGAASSSQTFTVLPGITSVSPSTGLHSGDSVTITGTAFGASQGSSTVKFNGTDAGTATSWSNTSITVAVPSGGTTGNVVVGVGGNNSAGSAFTANGSWSVTVN